MFYEAFSLSSGLDFSSSSSDSSSRGCRGRSVGDEGDSSGASSSSLSPTSGYSSYDLLDNVGTRDNGKNSMISFITQNIPFKSSLKSKPSRLKLT